MYIKKLPGTIHSEFCHQVEFILLLPTLQLPLIPSQLALITLITPTTAQLWHSSTLGSQGWAPGRTM